MWIQIHTKNYLNNKKVIKIKIMIFLMIRITSKKIYYLIKKNYIVLIIMII